MSIKIIEDPNAWGGESTTFKAGHLEAKAYQNMFEKWVANAPGLIEIYDTREEAETACREQLTDFLSDLLLEDKNLSEERYPWNPDGGPDIYIIQALREGFIAGRESLREES